MLSVRKDQCERIAETVKHTVLPKKSFSKPHFPDEQLLLIAFYTVLLCHNTKGKFRGIINGREKKGQEYIMQALIRTATDEPKVLELKEMAKVTQKKLTAILSDALGNPPQADDLKRRTSIMKENAKACLELGGFEPIKKEIYTVKELIQFLKKLPGFHDPLGKKAFLLIGMLHEWDIWPLSDSEHIGITVDYHIMRGAFRTGIVEITDKNLEKKIRDQVVLTEEENNQVRKKVFEACAYIAAFSGHYPYELSTFLWNLFRYCCPKDEDPCCTSCNRVPGCKLCKQYPFTPKGVCHFSNVCMGAKDDKLRSLVETTVNTENY